MAEDNTEKGLMAENQPPSYTETADPESQGQPPSYSSLFGELKQAKQESTGHFDFLKKFFAIVFGTVGFLIFLGLMLAIPIASIVIGALHLDDCKVEPLIPIYLVVAGAFGCFRNILGLFGKAKDKRKQDCGEEIEQPGAGRRSFEGIIDCFLFAWFICGNVWIYKNYAPIYNDTNSPNYCDKTVYLFAFWTTTVTYIIAGTVCVCGCCVAICAAAFS